MKKFIITICFAVLCATTFGQSFADLKNKKGNNPMLKNGFKVYVRQTSVTSKFTPNYGGQTINIGWRDDEYDKGGIRTRYENPTLGDFLHGIPKGIKTVNAIRNNTTVSTEAEKWEDHAHGGGFLGWFQYYFNVVAKDKLLISPGISMGDYIYGSKYETPGNQKKEMDPYGYYLAAGPAVMATYLVSNKLWLDGYVNYDLSFLKVKNQTSQDYEKPHFVSVGTDIYTSTKLFGGIRYNKMIDRGISNDQSSRLDISIGIGF